MTPKWAGRKRISLMTELRLVRVGVWLNGPERGRGTVATRDDAAPALVRDEEMRP